MLGFYTIYSIIYTPIIRENVDICAQSALVKTANRLRDMKVISLRYLARVLRNKDGTYTW